MSHKHVYRLPGLPAARNAVAALKTTQIHPDRISLIARADIEMERISDDYRDASTDFVPAALKGALGGGGAGLVAGVVAMAFPPLGITVAGAAAIAAVGALTGTWAGALVGSTLPDPIRRQFEEDIEAGRVLLVIEREEDDSEGLRQLDAVIAPSGGIRVEHDSELLTTD